MNARSRFSAVCVAWIVGGAVGGCRFDRFPVGDPYASDASLSDAGRDAGSNGHAGAGGAGGTASTPGGGAGGGDPSDAAPGGADAGDALDATTEAVDAGATGDGGCATPQAAVCDPITNSGCPLSMQCAADLAAPVRAGYCTFSAPMDGGLCLNTLVTESCPPTSTCISGVCRTLCACDAQCGAGECCNEPLGNAGFKVCGQC